MTTIREDLERGHSIVEVLGEVRIQRVFYISDLVSTPDGQLLEALRDPGVPKLGDPYPNEPQWFVIEDAAEPAGPNAARLTYTYSNRQGSTWNQSPPAGDGQDVKQFSGSTRIVKTTNDRTGTPMVLSPPVAYEGWDNYQSEAQLQVPTGELVFERSESTHPAPKWRTYGGTVNESAIGNYAAETLLFTRLDSQSTDGGRIWQSTYRFAYDPIDNWNHYDAWHGPDGKVPDGATRIAFEIVQTSNFSLLGLDFTDSQTPI